ncbi:MAG TPA: acyl-CoA synthetase, partial [Candidatus Omnitrophota bacterium]|nr:acyl-CoA synthetase [Candidatus Omnitrophota bacterium]
NNAQLMELRPGSPGRVAPGITVEAVDENGRLMRAGERGMLAVSPGTPGAFLGYLGEDLPGRLRLPTGWLMTGRLGSRDLDGYLWPGELAVGDGCAVVDGTRVAMDEVAAALRFHPRVADARVVARGSSLRAFVVAEGDAAFARELQDWIATRRGLGEVPRIEFVATLPDDDAGDDIPTLRIPSPDERW